MLLVRAIKLAFIKIVCLYLGYIAKELSLRDQVGTLAQALCIACLVLEILHL